MNLTELKNFKAPKRRWFQYLRMLVLPGPAPNLDPVPFIGLRRFDMLLCGVCLRFGCTGLPSGSLRPASFARRLWTPAPNLNPVGCRAVPLSFLLCSSLHIVRCPLCLHPSAQPLLFTFWPRAATRSKIWDQQSGERGGVYLAKPPAGE